MKRVFQIYVDGSAQSTSAVTYNTKLESGKYIVKLIDVSVLSTATTGIEYELRSSFLANFLGNCTYYTFLQAPDTSVPIVPKLTEYYYGELILQQYMDIWIVDKATGAPHADFDSAILTFDVERLE